MNPTAEIEREHYNIIAAVLLISAGIIILIFSTLEGFDIKYLCLLIPALPALLIRRPNGATLTAERDGVVIRMPHRQPRLIPYSGITDVELSAESTGRVSRGVNNGNIRYVHSIRIETKNGSRTFRARLEKNVLPETFGVQYDQLIMDSPFRTIEQKIRQKALNGV